MFLRSLLLFLFLSPSLTAQYSVGSIPNNLSEDVNAVIRDQHTVITLDDYNSMTISKKEVITVFNRNGLIALTPVVGYDKNSSVKELQARIFDKNGKVLKKFKKKDFVDASATGSNLYTDNRKMYLDFAPSEFPFTLEFESEIKSSSTAFLPKWDPSA